MAEHSQEPGVRRIPISEDAQLFYEVFGPHSPKGEKLLKRLETIFQGALFVEKSTDQTLYNVGQYELVQYMKEKVAEGQHGQ